jgi:SOS-response transcriptional repressors (RecA-mediated autopeptidases)
MSMGERIAKLRDSEHLTQEELAIKVGLTRAALSHYEKGRREPDIDTVKRIADYFGVSLDYLMGYHNLRDHPTVKEWASEFIPAAKKAPILGSIPCGMPLEEFQDRLGEEFLPPDIPPGEYYYLIASGDSMEPTIMDGDRVLVHVTTDIVDGKIYAVRVDDESTLKRVYRYNGRIELVPDNPKHIRQIYSKTNIYIHGEVLKVTRDIK